MSIMHRAIRSYGPPTACLAVDFFFVLSGFVIGHAYEKALLSNLTPFRFMARRLIRLYPLYWLALTIALLVAVLFHYPNAPSYFCSIFFLPAPPSVTAGHAVQFLFPLNFPAWSLSLEIGVNLVYALLCAHLTTRRLIALLVVGSPLLALIMFHYNDGNIGAYYQGYLPSWWRVIWSSAAGLIIYRQFSAKKRSPSWPPWFGLLLGAALFVNFACPYTGPWHSFLSCLLLFPAVVWTGAGTAIWRPAKGFYVFLGKVSYAVYILHIPIWFIEQKCLAMLQIDTQSHLIPVVIACCSITLAGAWALDLLYDLPVRAFLTRRFLARKASGRMTRKTSPTSPTKGDHAFLTLDALRGVAAISVTIYHFTGYMTNYQQRGLPNANLAVDFFFILSGFVIAYAYEKRILMGQTAAAFMGRRLIRLYPLYWLGITLPMLAFAVKHRTFPFTYLLGLFFLPTPPSLLPGGEAADLTITNIFPLNHPSWSLSCEIGINLIFALLIRHMKTQRLVAFITISGIAFVGASLAYGSIDLGWSWPGYWGGWARVAWSFFCGVLLYRLYTLKRRKSITVALGFFLAAFLFADFAYWENGIAFEFANVLFLLPVIVWFGARTKVWEPARRLYVWLGRSSYAIYIIHMPLMPIYMLIAKHLKMDPYEHIPLTVAVTTVLSLIAAILLDLVYDIPLRSALTRRFFPKRSKPVGQ